MSEIYFSSDWHLNDPRLELGYRDYFFSSVDEMNSTIINNANSIVKEDDKLILLGDICYDKQSIELLDKIQCKNKYLIYGNYDIDKLDLLENKFKGISELDYSVVTFNNKDFGIILAHKPSLILDILYNKKENNINQIDLGICGHVHSLWKVKKYPIPMINVSVDVWNFKPVSFSKILFCYNGIVNHYDENVFFEDYDSNLKSKKERQ